MSALEDALVKIFTRNEVLHSADGVGSPCLLREVSVKIEGAGVTTIDFENVEHRKTFK